MKDDQLYLIHISECIERVVSYTPDGKKSFLSDTKTQDAVLRNLQVLAESTRRLSEKTKNDHPEVDWRSISGFRNVAVHDYLGIDLKQVWDIVENDLPDLHRKIKKILNSPHP
jgi:uncharacterized protein with HEPN domain